MKRYSAIILLLCLMLCFSGCFLEEACVLYSDSAREDGFFIAINKFANCCFVSGYNCTEYTENLEITIPDECDGVPIKRIGGYFGSGVPSPFSINIASLYMNTPEDSKYDVVFHGDINNYGFSEEYVIEDVVFNLNIGKNIEVIDYVEMNEYYPHINEDDSITFYHPVINIHCSDENKYFYSKDGKLYNKKTNELIPDFSYASSN